MLDGPKTSEDLQPHISYYLDDNWERTIPEILGDYAKEFRPIETKDPDFGYTSSKIWLRIDFENTSELEEDWRLYFKENFKQLFDVYVIRENFSVENVLSQDLERGFDSRPVQYPELVAPILIKPGSKVTVLVNFWSEGASYIQLSMETATSFAQIASTRTAKNFVYYGMMLLLLLAASIAMVVYRHWVFPAYIFYAASTLVFLMHSDGVAYQYFWPSFPKFNSSASIYTGSAIILSACIYARVFLRTARRHPWVDKLLLAVIVITAAMVVGSFFLDNQIIKRLLVMMSLVAVLACTFSGIVAAFSRFKEVRFFLLAWVGVLVAASIMNLRHQLGIEISQDFQNDLIRFVIVLEAAFLGLAISDRYNQLRAASHTALKESLASAERNLYLSRRLIDLENQFSAAAEIAASRDAQFTNTIHDLKQPIHALRLRVNSLMESTNADQDSNDDVEETFGYLEGLMTSHLAQEQTEMDTRARGDQSSAQELSLNDVLKSVHEMFLPDAAEKNIDFKFLSSSLQTSLPSLVVMRLATNLVSNSIKYTQSGKILMGCRRIGKRIRLEVHDTGRGMSEEEFERALQRNVRLEGAEKSADGHGVGLSIVGELARKHGLTLSLCPDRRGGSTVRMELPAV